MKNIVLALFALWFLSLHFYLYVPLMVSVTLGAAFVSAATVAILNWLYGRNDFDNVTVDRDGSLGL
jgi:hypothetical protein